MAIVSVKIPQLGEGLQEARLVELLKQPGDSVKKDETIYEIETDKAITEIESPYDGTLVEWIAAIDSVLPIGAEIARMEVADGTPEMAGGHDAAPTVNTPQPPAVDTASNNTASNVIGEESAAVAAAMPMSRVAQAKAEDPVSAPPASQPAFTELPSSTAAETATGGRNQPSVLIPPKTRQVLRDHGVAHLADQIPAAGKRLMPADVDAFVASRQAAVSTSIGPVSQSTADYEERPLNSTQRTLNYRMSRGAQVVLPATLQTDIDWTALHAARESVRESGGPTGFAMFSWCVVQAMMQFPQFRSSLSPDGETLRTYRHVNLGIAVALEGDRLHTAVVRRSDTLNKNAFFSDVVARITEARNGKDQIDASTTVSVSNIGNMGMRVGIPVVVTPAVATIALGSVRDEPVPLDRGFEFRKMASLTMSFDHRIVNGVGAANFLNAIRQHAEEFQLE